MKIIRLLFLVLLIATFSFAATNVSTCQVISSSDEYDLITDLSGAPYVISPFSGGICVAINASDVVFDCKGYNVTNNGTTGLTVGIVAIGDYQNVTIQNCPSVSDYQYGAGLDGVDYSTIRNVSAHDNRDAGIYIARYGNNNLIIDNTAYNNGLVSPQYARDGYYMYSGTNNTFINNVAFNNSYGFDIRPGSNTTTMTNNTAYDNWDYGFIIDDSEKNRLENNNISNSEVGIGIFDDASDNVVINNTLTTGAEFGIYLADAGYNNQIIGNTISGFGEHGIYLIYTDQTVISGNNASNNDWAGFYLSNSDSNNITDNTANSNDYYGIWLTGSAYNRLINNNATLNGDIFYCTGPTTFHLSQLDSSGQWNEAYSAPFSTTYSTKEFQFSKVQDTISLRIVQSGPAPFADVEAIQFSACGQELKPTYARYVDSGESVLEDILTIDNNVIDAHEKAIEISWNVPISCSEPATVYLTANEYSSGAPMFLPLAGHVTVSQDTAVPTIDGKLDETDGIATPTYTEYWRSDSGHPEGYTYVYTSQDEENVYISLDITSDNTNEYGEDWAEVTFFTYSGNRAFRIDDYHDEYGKCGFGLTSKVSYKHQTCEFSIPKSEIGSEELNFVLRYYGTEDLEPSAILLQWSNGNTLQGNLMSGTQCGNGGFLFGSPDNTLTNNTESRNWGAGLYLVGADNAMVTGDHIFNNSYDIIIEYDYSPFNVTLSNVVVDNPLGNFASYTTLSLIDEINVSSSYSINWTSVPPSPPYSSFAGKSVEILAYYGANLIDSIAWSWSDGELSLYDETAFELWEYNSTGNWSDMNATLDTGANTLSLSNLDPGSVYSILTTIPPIQPTTPSTGGGAESKKTLTATYGQVCPGDSIEVNVTSGGSALENANVRLIYEPTYTVTDKLTNSSGSALFSSAKPGNYKLIVDKPTKYIKVTMDFTYSACPTVEKPVEKPPVQPPVTPPTTPPANITPKPSVNASDQKLTDSAISVDNAYLDKSGCVVIHLVNSDGSAGTVVGKSSVFSGNRSAISITLSQNATDLMAMLHYDDGDGICDPAKDKPATVNGTPVTDKFKVTLPAVAPPTKPPEPAKPAAPSAPAAPEPADDFMGVLLMLLLLLILVGGAAAAYYYFVKKK